MRRVGNLCEHLAKIGYEITWLEVDRNGEFELDDLRRELRPDTALVSVMMANNETGVLFPIEAIGHIVREKSEAVFHVDGVQAVGKVPINLAASQVDLFSISGHKLHAPKGVGALYIRHGVELPPFLIGGGQEGGRRSGTEAVPNIVALGRACQLAREFTDHERIRLLRDRLEDQIQTRFPFAQLNGTADRAKRLPNTSNIAFENLEGPRILAMLDDEGICVSTGSACNAESREVSGVLRAMKVPYRLARGSIRFSLGRYNTMDEVDRTLNTLTIVIERLTVGQPR
jgi:cysteine desulfurase